MGLINKTSALMKKKSDIVEFFQKVHELPHLLYVKVLYQEAFSQLILVDNIIKINVFHPLKINQDLKASIAYQFTITALIETELFEINFDSVFQNFDLNDDKKTLIFSLPKYIEYTKRNYSVIPDPKDNITLQYQLKNMPEYRKVILLSDNELRFFVDSDLLLKDNVSKTLYQIELKLPFDKLLFKAELHKIDRNHYSFKHYINNKSDQKLIANYMQYDFIRRHPEVKENMQANQYEDTLFDFFPDSLNKSVILIYDDKPSVTEYLCEFLSKRIKMHVIQVNQFDQIEHTIKEYKIKLLIINENAFSNVDELIEHYSPLNIPLIITKKASHQYMINEEKYSNYVALIDKPVEGKELLALVHQALEGKS